MIVRFLKDQAISDGFKPTLYKEGEVYDLSDLALDFVLHNGIAVPVTEPSKASLEPSETKVTVPSSTKVTRPSKKK